jgi:hypothetical protein
VAQSAAARGDTELHAFGELGDRELPVLLRLSKNLPVNSVHRKEVATREYADLHGVLLHAARSYATDVKDGSFPGPDHAF